MKRETDEQIDKQERLAGEQKNRYTDIQINRKTVKLSDRQTCQAGWLSDRHVVGQTGK